VEPGAADLRHGSDRLPENCPQSSTASFTADLQHFCDIQSDLQLSKYIKQACSYTAE